ncbi:MAG: Bax inhibitor-1/YccA family protein [Pseudomonadota bacterium]
MADYDNRLVRDATSGAVSVDAGLRAHMLRVYNYMVGALALTGIVAWATANSPLMNVLYRQVATQGGVSLQPTIPGWIVLLAPLALVFFLSFRIAHMSYSAAQATFWSYAALVGASLASIFVAYTGASIASTFFVTAATFGVMSLWGYTTGRDLTGFGSFLGMGVIGLVIAMLVNMFFQSPAINFMVSILGVLIFTGLTAYDTQKIKNYYFAGDDGEMSGKKAIMGALSLYLDFLNIFLFLLRFMGNRR